MENLLLSQITESATNPRTTFHEDSLHDLSESIKAQGVLQPILVRPVGKKKYEIISGARRYRAAKLAELKEIPVIVREGLTDGQILDIQITENLQRENPNVMDEALGYKNLIELHNMTPAEIATR